MNLVNPYRFGKFEFPEDLVSGFIHGYSTARKLREAYTGDAFNVTRVQTEPFPVTDIGFSNNIIDLAALEAFQVGGGSIVMNTKYDQIGGRNYTSSGNTRPITNTSFLVSGRLYSKYDGHNDFMSTSSATPITDKDCTVFVVFESQASDSLQTVFNERTIDAFETNRIISDTRNTGFIHSNYRPAEGTPVSLNFSSQQPQSTKRCYIFRRSGTTIEAYDETGGLIDSDTGSDTFPSNTFFELGRFNGTGFTNFFSGKIAELLINNTALSTTDRNLVLDNIKDFYSIT